MTTDLLLITASVCLIISLALAWLASLILYAKIGFLKQIFKANHQLIRAHIDYLLMMILLVVCFYLIERLQLVIPNGIILLTCLGALYNPFGFIILAIKPHLANTETTFEKARALIGFLPATIGFGGIAVYTLISLLN